MPKRIAAAALAVLALTTLSACSGSRPEPDEISSGFNKYAEEELGTDALNDAQLDCISTIIYDSDLSNEAVRAIADGDVDYEASQEDYDIMTDLNDEMIACVTDNM